MKKDLAIHKYLNQAPNKAHQFFDAEGHLNDSAVSLYVEAKLLQREAELPTSILHHIEECPHCQHEILEFYEWMKSDESVLALPTSQPYLDRVSQSPRHIRYIYSLTKSLTKTAAVLLVTVCAFVLYWFLYSPKPSSSASIQSPFKDPTINVAYSTWETDVEETKTFYLPNGSYFRVPAHAFCFRNGEPVKGKVQLKYREIRKLADLIVSGIPHNLSEGIDDQYLETAGIFEIRGWQGEEPVYLVNGKSIEVNMLSSNADTDFNHYFLQEKPNGLASLPLFISPAIADQKQAFWRYLNKSILACDTFADLSPEEILKQKSLEIHQIEQSIQHFQLLQAENKAINNYHSPLQKEAFLLSLDTEENPFLIKYQNQTWQYAGDNIDESPTQQNHWVLREKWDDLILTEQKYKALTLEGHRGTVNSALFSPDGKLIVTASTDHTAKLWSNQAQYLLSLEGHTAGINTAVFSPDGEYILTASNDHTAKVWTITGDRMVTLHGHQGAVLQASFSPDGRWILTTSADFTSRLWTARGELIKVFKHGFQHGTAQFSGNSQYFFTIPNEKQIILRNISGDSLATLKGNFNKVAFSQDSQYLITTSKNTVSGKASIWTIQGKRLRELDLNDEFAVFSPDGSHLVTFSGDDARLWYWNRKNPHGTQLIRNMMNIPEQKRDGHESKINQLGFSPDGKFIITASDDKTARIWSLGGGVLHTLRGHTGSVNSIEVSPNGLQVLTASHDNTAKLWVEREIKDVFELKLVKNNRRIQDHEGNLKEIKGKVFYSMVKLIDSHESQSPIVEARPQDNPLPELLERYELLLAETQALESQKVFKQSLCFRHFVVRQFGFYNCARISSSVFGEMEYELNVSSEKNYQGDVVKLFKMRNGDVASIQSFTSSRGKLFHLRLNPDLHERVLVIFPNDFVAVYKAGCPTKEGATPTKQNLELESQAKIFTKQDLDRILTR
jgi:WD40 repeat protein